MENNTNQKISTPVAIIVAGFLVMLGFLLTKTSNRVDEPKTLSEQVGVSKSALASCVKDIDKQSLNTQIMDGVAKAMKDLPDNERGTPYSIVIGKNGAKADIRGADSYENVKKIIDEVKAGKVTKAYTGEVALPDSNDHIVGNKDAQIVVVEYSDFECPYCKIFQSTMKRIVGESNGNIAWVYRHWPIHQNSFEKLVASECVSKIKGNDAFWKYVDLLFGLIKTSQDSVTDQL